MNLTLLHVCHCVNYAYAIGSQHDNRVVKEMYSQDLVQAVWLLDSNRAWFWSLAMPGKAHTCSVHGNEVGCELAAKVILGVQLLPAAQQPSRCTLSCRC